MREEARFLIPKTIHPTPPDYIGPGYPRERPAFRGFLALQRVLKMPNPAMSPYTKLKPRTLTTYHIPVKLLFVAFVEISGHNHK